METESFCGDSGNEEYKVNFLWRQIFGDGVINITLSHLHFEKVNTYGCSEEYRIKADIISSPRCIKRSNWGTGEGYWKYIYTEIIDRQSPIETFKKFGSTYTSICDNISGDKITS